MSLRGCTVAQAQAQHTVTFLEKKRLVDQISRMPSAIHSTLFEQILLRNPDIRYTRKTTGVFIDVANISDETLRTLIEMINNYNSARDAGARRREQTEQYAEQLDHLGSDSGDN